LWYGDSQFEIRHSLRSNQQFRRYAGRRNPAFSEEYNNMLVCRFLFLFLVAGLCWPVLAPIPAGDEPVKPIELGVVKSLAHDQAKALESSLGSFLKNETGMECRARVAGDALQLGKLMKENKYQLGFFHGIEFAWAQKKYPDLRPLVMVVSKYREWHALVVVKKKSAASFAMLKGKELVLPERNKPHCRLFLDKLCGQSGGSEAFFGRISHTDSIADALDNVFLNKAQATIVDDLGWEYYKDLKPGCHARLQVLEKSELFPAGLIAFRQGGIDKATCERCRERLLRSGKTVRSRESMTLLGITAFEPVPGGFDRSLTKILELYPEPHRERKQERK
jgi:ABC-type phosphate/phosphonate transport system substrate-binding protein